MGDASIEVAARANRATLPQHVHKPARVLGRVARLEEGRLVLEASDHGEVVVNIPGVDLNPPPAFAEVVGHVNEDLSLDAQFICPITSFDLETYEQALQTIFRFPEIF